MVERPEPHAGPGQVKVRVLRTGICGTDLHIRDWDRWAQSAVDTPLVLGHEFFGEVVETGPGTCDVRPGDLVSGEGHLVCGTCRNCRAGRRHLCIRTRSIGVNVDGAFAEYVVIPSSNLWVHRAGASSLDPDVAAIFDPLGNAVHTALMFPLAGEDVLITGAGPIGLMAAAVTRMVGARHVVITDTSAPRLELARGVGVDLAIDVTTTSITEAQRALGMAEGFDIGLEMSGSQHALPDMIANMTHGGRIALLGLSDQEIAVDWGAVVSRMLTVRGVYGREMFETWYTMSSLLQAGLDVSGVITHRYLAEDWEDGFAAASGRSGGKVVLDWS
jgi:threonine 3-dehydrogenase